MADRAYDATFFDALRAGAAASAERVLPLVFDLLRPASVVDIGCGTGTWLAVAARLGARIAGVDGDWVPRGDLEIPAERFVAADLAAPLDLGAFDLALCLEVAEHLPPAAAPMLVATLARHAPAILFSAAIPGQGGTGHVNEAWPDDWVRAFGASGFEVHDVIRPAIWSDEGVEPWYRQNLLLFLRPDHPRRGACTARPAPLAVVHPQMWAQRARWLAECEAVRDAVEAEVARLGHEWQAVADERDRLAAELDALREETATLRAALPRSE